MSGSEGSRPRRIHVCGGPGSGKTRLALELGGRLGLPVHHLDEIARVGGGHGPVRTAEERELLLSGILRSETWITEGVHLLWTEPLLERADVVVWLDYVSWPRATRRIMQRFAQGAVHEMRSRSGRERLTRFGDYARHLRALGVSILEARGYYAVGHAASADAPTDRPEATPGDSALHASTGGSRSATATQLSAYQAKLVHCRSSADVSALARTWT